MKKLIAAITVLLVLLLASSSCNYKGNYDDGYDDGYADGYTDGCFDGRIKGYEDGIAKAQKHLAFAIDDDLSELGYKIEREYGMHPEDALMILSNYADVPDEASEDEVDDAIWAIYRYYYESLKVIDGIED